MSNLKNVQLATAVSISTTYAGEFAGEYIAAALLSASTINDGGLTVKANIGYKEVIKKLSTSALVQPATCDFDPTSTITTAGQQVAAVGGGLNAGNIITELQKVVSAIPNTLYGKDSLRLYIPSSAAKFYVQALGGFSVAATSNAGTDNKGTQWWNNGSLTVDGVQIFVCPGMSDNKMYAAEVSNLYFGTGLLNNNQEIRVLDMVDLDGSNNVRMVMRFTSGVQFGVASDIVEYA